jgi:hypothetical protein
MQRESRLPAAFSLRRGQIASATVSLGSYCKDYAAIAIRISPRKGRSVKAPGRIHDDPSIGTRPRGGIEDVNPAKGEFAVGPAGELENRPTAIAVVAGFQPAPPSCHTYFRRRRKPILPRAGFLSRRQPRRMCTSH